MGDQGGLSVGGGLTAGGKNKAVAGFPATAIFLSGPTMFRAFSLDNRI